MKIIRLLLDLIFVTRPVVLVPVIGFSLFGVKIASEERVLWQWISLETVCKLAIFTLSVAAVYIANQLEDYDVDADNDGFPLLVKSGLSKRSATLFTLFLALLSLLLPLGYGDWVLSLFSLATLIIGYLYCFKPFYFTGRPIFDFLSNGLGYGLVAFLVGWNCIKPLSAGALLAAVPYITMMFAGSISSTLPDMAGDEKHQKITTAVKLGKVNAHILATFFLLVTLVLGWCFTDYVAMISAGAALPVYILYLIKPTQSLMEATYKVGGGISMLVIGFVYPLFILLGVLVTLVTILYFRIFHNVVYPSLLPVEDND